VISISPDKAGPPVTGRGITLLHKRSAEAGETLAGMRAGFQAEIHNKGWQMDTDGKGNHVAEHDRIKCDEANKTPDDFRKRGVGQQFKETRRGTGP
jgi:hypothetical protein